MSYTRAPVHSGHAVQSSHSMSRFVRAVRQWLAEYLSRARHRKTVTKLLSCTDRELRDVGLERADVEAALRTSGPKDVSATLAEIRAQRFAANPAFRPTKRRN